MSGGVDEVQLIADTVARFVIKRHTLSFDRDAALALNIESIENLLCHFTLSEAAAGLNEAIGKRRLAVVNMGNN